MSLNQSLETLRVVVHAKTDAERWEGAWAVVDVFEGTHRPEEVSLLWEYFVGEIRRSGVTPVPVTSWLRFSARLTVLKWSYVMGMRVFSPKPKPSREIAEDLEYRLSASFQDGGKRGHLGYEQKYALLLGLVYALMERPKGSYYLYLPLEPWRPSRSPKHPYKARSVRFHLSLRRCGLGIGRECHHVYATDDLFEIRGIREKRRTQNDR